MPYPKGDTNPGKRRRYPTGTGYGGEKTSKPAPPKTEVPEVRSNMKQTTGYETQKTRKSGDRGGKEPGDVNKRSYTDEPKNAAKPRRVNDHVKHLS